MLNRLKKAFSGFFKIFKSDGREGRGDYYSAYILGASILVGSILISATIFYNTKLLAGKLDGSLGTAGGDSGAQVAQNGKAQNDGKPSSVPARSDAPVIGNKNAKVTMIEFSDFQCPFCKSYYQNSYSQIKKQYVDTGKVKIIFRNFPLPFHVNAQKAAEAGECANRQGKFWEYRDLLFTNGQSDGAGLDTASLKKYAERVGLDTGKFNSCLDNGEATSVVKKDLADGQSAGVNGTPSFFINGKSIVGAQPFATISSVIDSALK